MDPITFTPLYQERVWGGRQLETTFHRKLPTADTPYGESWELVDRDPEQSVVDQGPWAGKTLHDLWTRHRQEVFGDSLPDAPRFPLLIKILDARDDLSIQVHPPGHLAASLGGEPKTEMWYVAHAEPGARLYAGLKAGVDRAAFEQALADGSVASCVHAIEPRPGESIFIPSGRIHAIGAGFLIFEIQQNSDTTYRVFDWNRTGLDGKPRQLHVAESLASIDFDDAEPGMDVPKDGVLAQCPHFTVRKVELAADEALPLPDPSGFAILAVAAGALAAGSRVLVAGSTALLPRGGAAVTAVAPATVLIATL